MAERTTDLMVVMFRFEQAPAPTAEGKSGRIAMLAASLLTLIAIGFGSMGLWRMGTDLGWAGDFVFRFGVLSHWQVWIGVAVGVQYASWWLARYAGVTGRREVQIAQPKNPRSLTRFD